MLSRRLRSALPLRSLSRPVAVLAPVRPSFVPVRQMSFIATFKKLLKQRMEQHEQLQQTIEQLEKDKAVQAAGRAKEAVAEGLKQGQAAATEAATKTWEAAEPLRNAAAKAADVIASDPYVQASVTAIAKRVEAVSKLTDDMESSEVKAYRKMMYERLKFSSKPDAAVSVESVDPDAPYGGPAPGAINTDSSELVLVAGQDAEVEDDAKGWQKVSRWFGRRADKLFGESEEAQVLSEILAKESDFNQVFFLRFVEKDLIPQVLEASVSGDLDFLRGICAEGAYKTIANLVKHRKQEGWNLDPRVLDVRYVQIASFKFIEEQPTLLISFQAQQVNCIRDNSGKIVYGSEHDIRNNHYIWALRHDPAQKEPRWEILEMAVQASLPTM